MKILLLGGTAEARALAALLVDAGVDVTSSLAGRVARPRLPVGAVRIGGFGGVEGLRAHLAVEGYDAMVDATHPFSEQMSRHAARAAGELPLLRLERPGWESHEWAGEWTWVDSHDEAAAVAATHERPFLTVGRQSLDRFVGPLAALPVLARVVDEPAVALPESWELLLSRGPYTLTSERELMARHESDVVVTKDSGGTWTWPKIEAAHERGAAVVVVRRKPGEPGVPLVSDPAAAAAWVAGL